VANADYVGIDVHRAARIMAAGHGGQVLMSAATRSLVDRSLGDGIRLRALGEHRLRDLSAPEALSQATADDLPGEFPSLRTLDASPNNLPMPTSRLVGRQTELTAIRDYLDSSDVRLLTLTGPGGTAQIQSRQRKQN
jgi:hypothetical protein